MAVDGALDVMVTDEAVNFAFTVTNTGSDAETLSFRTGQKADFAVLEDGQERWRWSDGQLFTQVLGSDTIPPGDSEKYEGWWNNPSPGTYTAVAESVAEDQVLEARADFSVKRD